MDTLADIIVAAQRCLGGDVELSEAVGPAGIYR